MENIFENSFISIGFSRNKNLVINNWKEATDAMTDEEYKTLALKQVAVLEEKKPFNWLVNLAELKFALTPQTQEWADGLFPRILNTGVKKIAFIISSDVFAQISVEQLMEEKNVKTANFEIHYFDNEKDALKWF